MAMSPFSSKVRNATKIVQQISGVQPGKRAKDTLGLNDGLRCITDGNHDVYFVKDWAVLLHHVVIEDPVCQVVVNACQDHHKQYGCSSKTLLAMIHLLSQAIWQLIYKRVPLDCIIKLTREIFDDCINYIHSITVPFILENHDYHHSEGYCVSKKEDRRQDPFSVELINYSESGSEMNGIDDFIEIPLHQKQTESMINKGNQTLFEKKYKQGTATSETLVPNPGKCKAVLLAMKVKDTVDDDDNVSWFFHTDNYTYASEQEERDQVSSEVSIENSKNKEKLTNQSSKTQIQDLTLDNTKTLATSFHSFGTTDCYDSDFEDCISDEDITKSTDSVLHNLKNDKQGDCNENVDDNEFDSCFSSSVDGDIPEKLSLDANQKACNSHLHSNKHSGQKSFSQAANPENREGSKSENDMETSRMSSKKSFHNEMQSLDKLLHELCVQKPAKTSNSVLNSSRHFKKFQSLENNVKISIFNSSTNGQKSTSKEVQNLDNITPQGVLNSSRHLQSFCSEPGFENKEKKNEVNRQELLSTKSSNVSCESRIEKRSLKGKSFDKLSSTKTISSIEELGRGLGRNSTMMNYAMDCFLHNQQEEFCKRFDRRLIFSTLCKGPPSNFTRLSDGLVLPCTTEDLSLMKDCPLRAVVINGDLKYTTHHKGYKQNLKGTRIRKTVEGITGKELWISDTLCLLEMLNVNVVFLRGLTDESLKERLQVQKILVFDEVPYKALEIISYVTSAVPLIYIHDAFEDNVCKSLKIVPYDQRYLFERFSKSTLCHVCFTSSSAKTLVICHPCQLGCEQKEQDFWLCVNRLANAVEDKKVLPGRGETEMKCHQFLQSQLDQAYSDMQDTNNVERLFRPVVLDRLSDVFRDFHNTVKNNLEASGNQEFWTDDLNSASFSCAKKNSAQVEKNASSESLHHIPEQHTSKFFQPVTKSNTVSHQPSVPVFDNFYCKISCWRKTVGTVIDNVRTDVLIQTGVDDSNIHSIDTLDKFL